MVSSYTYSMHPSEASKNDDKLWSETSQIYAKNTEATSEATPSAAAKYWLASLLNIICNPNISKEEDRELIRNSALEGTVLVDGVEYCKSKRTNPGAAVDQYFSAMPATVSISDLGALVKIPHGLHKNSVILGPGIVDAEGTPLTAGNYVDMLGKQLYISPVLLRKYGLKSGSSAEYVEYLCTDSKGTGAGDKISEAHKSIASKSFTVTITD